MQHVASFSGGKDSTAMVLKLLEENKPLDRIVYCDVGLDFGEQRNYIKICLRKFKEINPNIKIDIVKSEKTFEEYFYTVNTTGKRKGQIWGWPFMLGAWCNSRLKMKPLNKYFREIGEHYRYIGIAYDEPKRYERLKGNCIAPLYDLKMNECDCMQYIKEKGYRNPMYWKFLRQGCYLCPKQNLNSLRSLRYHYPDLWSHMLQLDKDSPVTFKADGTTLWELEHRFKWEDINGDENFHIQLVELDLLRGFDKEWVNLIGTKVLTEYHCN